MYMSLLSSHLSVYLKLSSVCVSLSLSLFHLLSLPSFNHPLILHTCTRTHSSRWADRLPSRGSNPKAEHVFIHPYLQVSDTTAPLFDACDMPFHAAYIMLDVFNVSVFPLLTYYLHIVKSLHPVQAVHLYIHYMVNDYIVYFIV